VEKIGKRVIRAMHFNGGRDALFLAIEKGGKIIAPLLARGRLGECGAIEYKRGAKR